MIDPAGMTNLTMRPTALERGFPTENMLTAADVRLFLEAFQSMDALTTSPEPRQRSSESNTWTRRRRVDRLDCLEPRSRAA